MPNLSVIRQKSHRLLNRKSHVVFFFYIFTLMCLFLINTTALDGDFVAVREILLLMGNQLSALNCFFSA